MRKAAKRTHEEKWRRIGTLLDAFHRMPQRTPQRRLRVKLMSPRSSRRIFAIAEKSAMGDGIVKRTDPLADGCYPTVSRKVWTIALNSSAFSHCAQ